MNKNFKEKSKSLPRPHTAKVASKTHQNIDQPTYLLGDSDKNEVIDQNPLISKTLYLKPPK